MLFFVFYFRFVSVTLCVFACVVLVVLFCLYCYRVVVLKDFTSLLIKELRHQYMTSFIATSRR